MPDRKQRRRAQSEEFTAADTSSVTMPPRPRLTLQSGLTTGAAGLGTTVLALRGDSQTAWIVALFGLIGLLAIQLFAHLRCRAFNRSVSQALRDTRDGQTLSVSMSLETYSFTIAQTQTAAGPAVPTPLEEK